MLSMTIIILAVISGLLILALYVAIVKTTSFDLIKSKSEPNLTADQLEKAAYAAAKSLGLKYDHGAEDHMYIEGIDHVATTSKIRIRYNKCQYIHLHCDRRKCTEYSVCSALQKMFTTERMNLKYSKDHCILTVDSETPEKGKIYYYK